MAVMKIQRIDVFQVNLSYSGGVYYLSGGREYSTFDATLVRITTECGLEGWGESTPFGATFIASHALGVRSGIAEIAPSLIGLDPRRVDRVYEAMDASLLGHEHAKAAIDVACWDILGKSTGLPVCELLGGRTDYNIPTITSLPAREASGMRALVEQYRAQGSVGFSVKVGGDPVDDAARVIEALKDKKRGEFFIVDVNGGYTVEGALRMLRLLPPGVDIMLEAPCPTWRENQSLRRRTDVPILLDELALTETSMIQAIADDAGEGINFKVQKFGGLTKARRIRDLCIAAGYVMSVQETAGSDIGFAALVHLSQTIPKRYLRCVLNSRAMFTVKIADTAFEVKDGHVTAPDVPGLGVTPRMEVLGEPVASYM